MEKSNLVYILQSLDRKEVRELRKWLESPAHNQREDVLGLYQYLFKDNSLKKGEKLGKEMAFKSVFPTAITYEDTKMRQCMHFFLKSLEDFLVYRELQEDEMHSKSILAKVFRKRRLTKSFEKNLKVTLNRLANQPIKNSHFHQNNYMIRSEIVRFHALTSRGQNIDYQELNNSLDVYYLADKLRQATLLISHQTVYKKTYDLGMLEEVLNYLKREKEYLDIPAIGMYYYALKCATDKETPSHFINFKKQIELNDKYFPLFEVRDLYLAAINYCINKFNSGQLEYMRESFELYKKGITRNFLMEDGYISKYTFQNLVAIGTRLKEFDWISTFVDDYNEYLHDKFRENVVHYSKALVKFEMGNYDEAMTLLNQLEYDDILMTLSGKTMQLRMYYELGYQDALESLISSTKTFLQRKKVIGYHKASVSNLLKYISKLARINIYDKSEGENLLEEVQKANPMMAKDWLIKQIQEL